MVYDVNNNSKSDHTGELSPFVSESKLTLSQKTFILAKIILLCNNIPIKYMRYSGGYYARDKKM